MKLLLTLLAICVCTASAIVCLPNYCSTIKCKELSEKKCEKENAVYTPNATFCGCCPACITQLNEGDNCLQLNGEPRTAECRAPLQCVNGTCQS